MTPEEKARLEALRALGETITAEEKAELDALIAKAAASGSSEYSEAYVKKLRDEAAANRIKAKELETKLAAFEGLDVEEIKKLKAAQEELDRKKLEDKGAFETLRAQLVESNKAEIAARDTAIHDAAIRESRLEDELKRTILANEVSIAASIAKALNPKVVEMIAMQNMKVETLEDGRRVTRIYDGAGNVKVDIKTGQPLTIVQYLEELKHTEEYAFMFAGGRAGAGSGTTNIFQGKTIENPWKKETRNLTLQGQIMSNDPNLAKRLKAEAGVN